jgi:hypothetical protein
MPRFFSLYVVLASAVVACSGREVATAPPDAGPEASSSVSLDGGPESDGSLTDATADQANVPLDTILASDADQIRGITSDGYVVYYTTTEEPKPGVIVGGGTSVVSLNGGPVSPLTSERGEIAGKAVMFYDYTGLNIWTAAKGTKKLAHTGPFNGLSGLAVSDDGSRVAYFDGYSIWVADADGAFVKTLVTGHGGSWPSDPILRFLPNGDLFAEYCLDGSWPPPCAASVFASADFTKRDLATQLQTPPLARAVDPTRTWFWAAGASGSKNGSLVNISSGVSTLVDSNAGECLFDASGQTLFYVSSGALKRAPVTNPTASTTLVASGVGAPGVDALWAISPDGEHILYSSPPHGGVQGVYGLYLASASAQAAPVRVADDGAFYLPPDSFTADSKFIVYTELTKLGVAPISGTPSTTLTNAPTQSYFTHDSTILYGDRQTNAFMTADLATGAPPRTFATTLRNAPADGAAEPFGSFQLTADRARVVYVNAQDHTLHVVGAP